MDKRTIIAFLLIGLIFIIWMSPLYRNIVESDRTPAAKSTSIIPSNPDSVSSLSSTSSPSDMQHSSNESKKTTTKADTAKATVHILQNGLIRAHLSSLGGGTLVGWEIVEKNPLDTSEYRYKAGLNANEPVQLIPENAVRNLAVTTNDNRDLGFIYFDLVQDSTGSDGTRKIRFTHILENGAQIEKTFKIRPGAYHLDMQIHLKGFHRTPGEYTIEWPSGLRSTESNIKDDQMYFEGMAFKGGAPVSQDGEEKEIKGGKIFKQKKKGTTNPEARGGKTNWVALRTKYFLMSLIPGTTAAGAELSVADTLGRKTTRFELDMPWEGTLDVTHSFQVFLGPMDYQMLKTYPSGLEKSMSFGWDFIKPLTIGALYTLHFFYRILKSYGWSIILFGILIKLLLHPLTRHSTKSMKAMQALQPKMNALREKYKDNPQKLNEETMKLYKTHGVNPMSGCLPMLLQMPILIALFNLFRMTIALRHEDFYLIKDLSAPDHLLGPINVLPIVLGITTILQQKLSSTQNPQQKAMMFMMPIFLTFIFYNFSSGLNLYYFVFNIFSIIQELAAKRKNTEVSNI